MEEPKYSENKQYETLANEMHTCKTNSIIGIIKMGKIFSQAKKELDPSKFGKWLTDKRVSISLRTSQRFMGIYKDYRHILEIEGSNKEIITKLDFSHLLELRKLPERFKKTVDIIEADGHTTKVDVMDEEKLDNFLNQSVMIDNKLRPVKDLPLSKLKKVINDNFGNYQKIEGWKEKGETIKSNENQVGENQVIEPKINGIDESGVSKKYDLVGSILDSLSSLNILMKDIDKIDEVKLFEIDEKDKQEYKRELNNLKSVCEAIIVRCNDKIDML